MTGTKTEKPPRLLGSFRRVVTRPTTYARARSQLPRLGKLLKKKNWARRLVGIEVTRYCEPYSARNASIGSTRVARRAGAKHATIVTATRTTAHAIITRGSRGETPYS